MKVHNITNCSLIETIKSNHERLETIVRLPTATTRQPGRSWTPVDVVFGLTVR